MNVYLRNTHYFSLLLNEEETLCAYPEFLANPQSVTLLATRYDENEHDDIDLICTLTGEELKQLINEYGVEWKPIPKHFYKTDGSLLEFGKPFAHTTI